VVLRPLPYDRDGRLVAVRGNLHKPGLEAIPGSAAEFVDYRQRSRVFDAIAAYDTLGVNLTGFDQPERVAAAVTTASLFTMLGESAVLGRSLVAADEQRDATASRSSATRCGSATSAAIRPSSAARSPSTDRRWKSSA
jgi:hypothetical protein